MLSRILEHEVMDTPAEAVDYDAMDHADVNRLFVDDLLAQLSSHGMLPSVEYLKILDLGTGTAQIPIELCKHTENVHVVAIDAAKNMLCVAETNVRKAGLENHIELRPADAKRLMFAAGCFDVAMSNSIIHHLPQPMECLDEAIRVVRAGGVLFFRDLMRPADEAEMIRLVNLHAQPAGISAASDHQRAMFSDSLRAALTLEEIRGFIAQLGFDPNAACQTSDRHWTWSAKKRGAPG